MISDVLSDAVDLIDGYLSDPTYDRVYVDDRDEIIKLRNEMDALRKRMDNPKQILCNDCRCDVTNDRYDNGDNKIRCGECSLKRYRKDRPFDVNIRLHSLINFKVSS
jgi:hypothetical protein